MLSSLSLPLRSIVQTRVFTFVCVPASPTCAGWGHPYLLCFVRLFQGPSEFSRDGDSELPWYHTKPGSRACTQDFSRTLIGSCSGFWHIGHRNIRLRLCVNILDSCRWLVLSWWRNGWYTAIRGLVVPVARWALNCVKYQQAFHPSPFQVTCTCIAQILVPLGDFSSSFA